MLKQLALHNGHKKLSTSFSLIGRTRTYNYNNNNKLFNNNNNNNNNPNKQSFHTNNHFTNSTTSEKKVQDFLTELKQRQVLNSATNGFEQLLNQIYSTNNNTTTGNNNNNKPIGIYAGFDPTASSLHVGNLLVIQTLKRFQKVFSPKQLHIFCLVGGATGKIGDPSGRKTERPLLEEELIQQNIDGLTRELLNYFKLEKLDNNLQNNTLQNNNATVVNNNDWLGQMNMIEMLRNVGKYFQLTNLLRLESVKSRLENADSENSGMTFTEFSYSLFQSYDFYHLFLNHNVRLQIGGSDQWGNITSGLEFIKKKLNQQYVSDSKKGSDDEIICGMTVPLLTTADGVKFGKSMGNAIWLNPERTSPFDFYQFFIRVQDADVEKLLKMLTFVSLEEIDNVMKEHAKNPELRIAQKLLAEQLTEQIHGKEQLETVKKCTELLFKNNEEEALELLKTLNIKDIKSFMKDSPSTCFKKEEIIGKNLIDICLQLRLGPSKSELFKLTKSGGLYLNYKRQNDVKYCICENDLIQNSFIVLRTGKKNYHLIEVI
ncbi:hypothetical protein ABK040_013948 [Willaertia magna]